MRGCIGAVCIVREWPAGLHCLPVTNEVHTTVWSLSPRRTRLILFKLLSNGFLSKIDGCLSTGKEANVYYARSGVGVGDEPEKEYAVKVYKTSILVFKDRDKYVSGEHRWRNGYCKSNPRKMVKVSIGVCLTNAGL